MKIQAKINMESIGVLFLMVYYAWFYLPYLRATFSTSFFKVLFFGCFVIGAALLFWHYLAESGGTILLQWNILIPIICYMVVMSVMGVLQIGDASNHLSVSFTFWGTAIIYTLLEYSPREKKLFIWFILVLLIINGVTSYLGLLTDERAARALANASTSAKELERDYTLSRLNISSIYFYQSLIVLVPICISMLKKRRHILIAAGSFLFIILIVVRASFAISMLMLLISIGISFINTKKPSGIFVIVLCIILALVAPLDEVFSALSTVIPNAEIAEKLDEIAHFFVSGTMQGDLAARMNLYQSSLKTFLSHPFGVGPHYSYVKYENGIGYHSQLLDDLARYGIFAIAFYVTFLFQYSKMLLKKWRKVGAEECMFQIIVIYIGFLILNLAFRSAAESVVMFVLLPGLPELLVSRDVPEKETQ